MVDSEQLSFANKTLVLQSHRNPLPYALLEHCVDSVTAWAQYWNYDTRWLGDELFSGIPAAIAEKYAQRRVVLSDLGRLIVMREALASGYRRVVWLDADMLVLDPAALVLPEQPFVVGRETWVQPHKGRPRVFPKVHNAFLCSLRDDPVLPFYEYSARQILSLHEGRAPDQVVGPKLLTAWHNISPFAVLDSVNMLPPAVVLDLLRGDGDYLSCYRRHVPCLPAALNLCTSALVAEELSAVELQAAAALLLEQPGLLAPV